MIAILIKNLKYPLAVLVCIFMLSSEANSTCVYAGPLQVKELQVGNMLSWTTLREAENKSFIVQKSMDGEGFETVGTIKGAGNSEEELKYRFLDIATGENKVFYRLLQLDFDGMESHSETVVVNRLSPNNFVVTAMSSTLTDGIFTLALRSEIENELHYNVKNNDGNIVKTGAFEIVDGGNMIAINLEDLDEGRYQFEMTVKDEKEHIFIRKVNSGEMPLINYAVKE